MSLACFKHFSTSVDSIFFKKYSNFNISGGSKDKGRSDDTLQTSDAQYGRTGLAFSGLIFPFGCLILVGNMGGGNYVNGVLLKQQSIMC